MHGGNVRALNRSDVENGAEIELELPKEGKKINSLIATN